MAKPGWTKRTPEIDARIASAIRIGATYRDAAAYAGISEDSLARWRERFADFAEMLTRAEAEGKIGWLARIERAGEADWRALAWKLERRYPQEFGKQVLEHQGPGAGPVALILREVPAREADDGAG